MATYKVIQDIESEDKLLGPLTLRQFIYAAIVIVLGFIAFQFTKLNPFLALPFLLPMGFFGLLAAPFGHDQSSEVWLLSRIRFFLKPRRRIWDQSGLQELVTITVPKKIEHALTNGLSQTEVKSRLRALADTIDSRGWAVKNVNVNLSSQPAGVDPVVSSDRLVDVSTLPQDVPTTEILAADDMLDEKNNLTAQHLETMISQAEQTHRQTLVQTMQGKAPQQAQQQNDYWFMHQPDPSSVPAGMATFQNTPTIAPGTATSNATPDNDPAAQALLDKIHKDQSRPDPGRGHMKVVNPAGSSSEQRAVSKEQPPVPNPKQAAVVADLAQRNDLNISTIAHEAQKATDPDDGEVVISLR